VWRQDGKIEQEIGSYKGEEPGSGRTDALHSLLVLRADRLEGCTKGSDEATEFRLIADTVEAYEAKRWPDGKVPGGKG
jgi:hypothetical protein